MANLKGDLLSSDGSLLLLREAERRVGLAKAPTSFFREWRDPALVDHTPPAMLRFRMFLIARSYEIAEGCDAPYGDPLFELVIDQAPESGGFVYEEIRRVDPDTIDGAMATPIHAASTSPAVCLGNDIVQRGGLR